MEELQRLYVYRESCALEAFNISSVKEFAYKIIPNISKEFKTYLSKFKVFNFSNVVTNFSIFKTKEEKVLKVVDKHLYVNLIKLNMVVPEGFIGKWLDYCLELEKSVNFLSKLDESLKNYNQYLSVLISTNDAIKSTSYNPEDCNLVLQHIEDLNKGVYKFFTNKNNKTSKPYGELIDSNSDLDRVLSTSKSLMTSMEQINTKDLLKQTQDICKLLDVLLGKINRKEIDSISNETVAKIGDSSYALAKYVEFYSITYYRVKSHLECLNHSMEILLKLD